MTQQDIYDALAARLMALPGVPDIAWEGLVYLPVPPRPYISARLSACTTSVVGAGPDGAVQHDGAFTMVAYCSADGGRQPAGQLAAAIRAFFGRSTVLSAAGQPVVLLNAAEQPSVDAGDWIGVPVVVTFTASDP